MSASKPSSPEPVAGTVSPRTIRIVRWSLAAIVVVVLALVFAVPRKPPPPPSPAQPEQAFVDRVGLVSPAFAREWAGALLDDPRAEIVIYVDTRPPAGDLSVWTIQSATDWKVGSAKNDTGLVLFVFKEPRLARMEVGYGLESVFTDARVRRLLEDHLAPAFGQGQYERGFDALIKALRDDLGGDAGLARAAEAAVKVPNEPWSAQVASAFERVPRMVSATVRNYLEEGPGGRVGILIFVAVGLGIVATGLALAANTVWRVATIPGKLREGKARGDVIALAADLKLFEIVMGIAGFAICFAMIVVVLLFAESLATRKGTFSGAGAAIVWPAPPR
jgi:uncharacterized membrane protein YgcG